MSRLQEKAPKAWKFSGGSPQTPSPVRGTLTPSHTLLQQHLCRCLVVLADSFQSPPRSEPTPFPKSCIRPMQLIRQLVYVYTTLFSWECECTTKRFIQFELTAGLMCVSSQQISLRWKASMRLCLQKWRWGSSSIFVFKKAFAVFNLKSYSSTSTCKSNCMCQDIFGSSHTRIHPAHQILRTLAWSLHLNAIPNSSPRQIIRTLRVNSREPGRICYSVQVVPVVVQPQPPLRINTYSQSKEV